MSCGQVFDRKNENTSTLLHPKQNQYVIISLVLTAGQRARHGSAVLPVPLQRFLHLLQRHTQRVEVVQRPVYVQMAVGGDGQEHA